MMQKAKQPHKNNLNLRIATKAGEVENRLQKPKIGTYRKSSHLVDQVLKYHHPEAEKLVLKASTIKQMKRAGVTPEAIQAGILLTPSESKLIDCLVKLLHHKSNNSNPKENNFLTGNLPTKSVTYGHIKAIAPRLSITPYELAREYKVKGKIGGKEMIEVWKILTTLSERNFLIDYKEDLQGKEKGSTNFQFYNSLILLPESSTTEKEIILNPIFARQIDTKFILCPNNLLSQTVEANGSAKVSPITFRLRDWLIRTHLMKKGSQSFTSEIGVEKLYYTLASKWMKASRKKHIKTHLRKAISTAKKLNLIDRHRTVKGSNGKQKIIFTLSKSWQT